MDERLKRLESIAMTIVMNVRATEAGEMNDLELAEEAQSKVDQMLGLLDKYFGEVIYGE